MTDELARDFADHPRFEERDDDFVPTTNDWDARVAVEDGCCRITVEVPTLDAAVAGEPVAPVVEDGWYETFELRVEDAPGVTRADAVEDPTVERDVDTVTVELALAGRPGSAADDALAVVNYVEGTWFEGIVPGYDYVEKVQELRERAHQNGQSEQSGTPL